MNFKKILPFLFFIMLLPVVVGQISVMEPVGNAVITCDSNTLPTVIGSEGTLVATVKNAADTGAAFDIYAQCPEPLDTGYSGRLFIEAGEIKRIQIRVVSYSNSEIRQKCVIYASPLNNPEGKVSCYQEIGFKPEILRICNEGVKYPSISEGAIKECRNNKWVIIQICDTNEIVDFEKATCEPINAAPDTTKILLILALIMIGGSVVYLLKSLFSKKTAKAQPSKEKKEIVGFCSKCGGKLSATEKFCSKCGNKL